MRMQTERLKVTLSHASQPNLFVDPENCLDNFRFWIKVHSILNPKKSTSLRSLRMTCLNRYDLISQKSTRAMLGCLNF